MPNFIYDEMLEIKKPFRPAEDKIDALAEMMTSETNILRSETIPAGYTYLSQFIDHDITLDLTAGFSWEIASRPNLLINYRTPFFDLETIYGFVEAPNNDLRRSDLLENASLLKIGETFPDGEKAVFQNDLPRNSNSPAARIIEPRNDENLVTAQTQVAFMRFHNAIVKKLGGENSEAMFEKARNLTILHYQWIIFTDFLPRFVKKEVLEDVLKNGNKFYKPSDGNVYMPLEFSVGAFRAGHSMIRNTYNWNRRHQGPINSARFGKLRSLTGLNFVNDLSELLEGKPKLPTDWIINWKLFFDIDGSIRDENFNFAEKINTKLSTKLGRLAPPENGMLKAVFNRLNSLSARDLFRGVAYDLPTGQEVAARISQQTGYAVLTESQLEPLLNNELGAIFNSQTPLWFYLLAEAELNRDANGRFGETLGDVGSRIVAETFIELLKRSSPTIFQNGEFKPPADFLGTDGKFGMPEMLKFIEDIDGNFINPLN